MSRHDDEFIESSEIFISQDSSSLGSLGNDEAEETVDIEEAAEPEPIVPEAASQRLVNESGGESLERYLREVSRWSLLSAEAERDLAKRTAKGDPAALEDLINRNL